VPKFVSPAALSGISCGLGMMGAKEPAHAETQRASYS
jgi:hypothetical protein